MSHPTLSLDFPIATFAANMEGTLSLLEAARLTDVRRIANFSSETIYGATAGPLTEEVPVKPSTLYAVTKVTTEWLGKVYTERYGLDVVSLRIAQVYGPGDRMPRVLGDMLKALTQTGAFELAHGSDHCFNFIHVRDVALATDGRHRVKPRPGRPDRRRLSAARARSMQFSVLLNDPREPE
jgi:nucleoside-diphosphate-sugar epimerase